MYKIFLAVGHRDLENFLKANKEIIEQKLQKTVKFVGETGYREAIIQSVADYRPDVILIREGLEGNANISDIIYKLKVHYSDTRIIFIAGDREIGDNFLATLVQLGVYDLVIGSKVNAVDMLKRIVVPNSFSDVAHLMPKITIDEKTNTKLFEAPDITPMITKVNDIEEEELPNIRPIKPIKAPKNNTKKSNENDDLLLIDDDETDIVDIEDDVPITQSNNIELKVEKTDTEVKKKTPIKLMPINKPKTETNDDLNVKKSEINQASINVPSLIPSSQVPDNQQSENTGRFGKLFGNKDKDAVWGNKKEVPKRITQQVITFIGGKGGVGNSQLAFNSALKLARDGYKTMYMDLNDMYSAIDCIFQLGYSDVGIDTAIMGIKEEDYPLIERSITNMNKILPETPKENYLYKTYNKMPLNLDFMFFSQKYMEREDRTNQVDSSYLKDLFMYLIMQCHYDFIIIDAQQNVFNKFTETSLIYSSKVFFTVTQDYSVIANHLNQIKLMDKKRIKFREKFYYLLNKYENADLSLNKVYNLLIESIRLEGFNIISVPNINKEFINANYLGMPILWYSKNKDLYKAFNDITRLATK